MIDVTSTTSSETLEAEVDRELDAFNEWFQAQGNGPIVRPEKAILKTFLWYKLKAGKNGT